MGIFADEKKKMAEEAAAKEQKKAEQAQVAHWVAKQLDEDMVGQEPGIDVQIPGNHVVVRRKTTNDQMEITCLDKETFEIKLPGEAQPSPANQQGMVRAVLTWLVNKG